MDRKAEEKIRELEERIEKLEKAVFHSWEWRILAQPFWTPSQIARLLGVSETRAYYIAREILQTIKLGPLGGKTSLRVPSDAFLEYLKKHRIWNLLDKIDQD